MYSFCCRHRAMWQCVAFVVDIELMWQCVAFVVDIERCGNV